MALNPSLYLKSPTSILYSSHEKYIQNPIAFAGTCKYVLDDATGAKQGLNFKST